MAHQEFINLPRTFSSFADRPYYQRLSSAHVAGGKYLLYVRLIRFLACPHISPFVKFNCKVVNKSLVLWMDKAHGQQSEIAGDFTCCSLHLNELGSSVLSHLPFKIY